MPFGRLHEEAAGDGKLLALSDAAWRMWGMALIYCQKNLTDGFIPTHAIYSFGVRAPNKEKVAEELCRVQVKDKAALWLKQKGGFQIHDYLQWNDSKVEILRMRTEGKERIAAWRERKRLEHEGVQANVRNALQEGEHPPNNPIHPVVRGSGSLEEKKSVGIRPNGPALRSTGVQSGSLPGDHLHHVACDESFSRCVPRVVHVKLVNKLAPKHGGDREAAAAALQVWYPTVWATLPVDFVLPADDFKFWQSRFDAAFASVDLAAKFSRKDAEKSTVPGPDRTAEYLRRQRQG